MRFWHTFLCVKIEILPSETPPIRKKQSKPIEPTIS